MGRSSTRNFSLNIPKNGNLIVKTAKACEGTFETMIYNNLLMKNPVNTEILLNLSGINQSKIAVNIFDLNGKSVFNSTLIKQGNTLKIPFEAYTSGIYILKLGINNINPIKILKQ